MIAIKVILIMLLGFAFMGAQLSREVTDEEFQDIVLIADYDELKLSEATYNSSNDMNKTYIERLGLKFYDMVIFAVVEPSGKLMEYGYKNPDQPYKFTMIALVLTILSALIVPLIYLSMFTFFGVKETISYFKNKKKK